MSLDEKLTALVLRIVAGEDQPETKEERLLLLLRTAYHMGHADGVESMIPSKPS